MRRFVLKTLAAGLAGTLLSLPALAQKKPVEVEFYYPVAVGGPITKIVDDMVADFQKENPDIRVKPIYAGSYQDSIAKALTALKGGTPPQLAVLLSTDMFTLIDEDAIVPSTRWPRAKPISNGWAASTTPSCRTAAAAAMCGACPSSARPS